MLRHPNIEILETKVYELLSDIGIEVKNDEMTSICLAKGCMEGKGHRIRIPKEVIRDMVAFQKQTEEEYEENHKLVNVFGPDWTHHLIFTNQIDVYRARYEKEFIMQAFDCGPTRYYDYREGKVKPVGKEIFAMMMKLAEATPEIVYTSTWYRHDLPPMIERIHSLINGMKYTKKLDGIEAIYPEVIKYLKEASIILTGNQDSSAFLAGSECMTMPLVLEKRSAEDILERKRCRVNRYHVTSMPTLGVSTPVTLAGSIAMGAAEILGGMALCWCVDPESDLSGRMIALIADMRNGNSTSFGPFNVQYSNAVRQLFRELWGGHCMVEVFFGPTAQRPGLQAVFENYYGTSCRKRWENDPGIPYAGMGILHNAGLGSPTQFMLDMEIRKAEYHYKPEIAVNDETLNWNEILEVIETNGNFLASEHTIRHIHDLWESPLFLSESPSSAWDGSEKAILDKCEDMWRANLEKWEPPDWPGEKIREMEELLGRAMKEFEIQLDDREL
jgi:trimethylamine--corrinoid protein Co-methyltransferase